MRQFKIYVDLDSVITAFDQAVKNLGPIPAAGLLDGASEEDKQAMYDAIEEAQEPFWAKMKWLPEGKKLWAWLKPFNPIILSSPGKFMYAVAGKKQWIAENIPGTAAFIEEDKWRYAERTSILVDDMDQNIGAWEHAGGIGILHKGSFEETKNKVLDAINKISPTRAEKILIPDILRDIAKSISI